MGLDQSSPKTALVINNVALFVALTVFQTLQASDCLSIRFLTHAAERANCLGWLKTDNTVKGGQ